MTVGRFVEGRSDDLGIDVTLHVGDLLGAFVDEEHDDVCLGIVLADGRGNLLQDDGLTSLWRSDDHGTLAFSDGGKHIDDTAGGRVVVPFGEVELLVGEEGSQMFKRYAIAHVFGCSTID